MCNILSFFQNTTLIFFNFLYLFPDEFNVQVWILKFCLIFSLTNMHSLYLNIRIFLVWNVKYFIFVRFYQKILFFFSLSLSSDWMFQLFLWLVYLFLCNHYKWCSFTVRKGPQCVQPKRPCLCVSECYREWMYYVHTVYHYH